MKKLLLDLGKIFISGIVVGCGSYVACKYIMPSIESKINEKKSEKTKERLRETMVTGGY